MILQNKQQIRKRIQEFQKRLDSIGYTRYPDDPDEIILWRKQMAKKWKYRNELRNIYKEHLAPNPLEKVILVTSHSEFEQFSKDFDLFILEKEGEFVKVASVCKFPNQRIKTLLLVREFTLT